ncbi:hypothetical protein H4582DRAFT_463088 [Lactarius indigo]|nr:hypothetical protein H4582DRAFT_463088 [Lactarius indigo]
MAPSALQYITVLVSYVRANVSGCPQLGTSKTLRHVYSRLLPDSMRRKVRKAHVIKSVHRIGKVSVHIGLLCHDSTDRPRIRRNPRARASHTG